jgi:hypothetical protein
MRPIVPILVLVAFASTATSAFAGKIFGDISMDGKPLPAGVKIKIMRPGTSVVADSTTTDKFGSFKLMVKEDGKTVLTVMHENKPLELAVFSNKEAMRYDLVIEKKEGKPGLRRK